MQGLVIMFSPKGNQARVFVRVINVETGDVYCTNHLIEQALDAESIMAARARYKEEYRQTIMDGIVFLKVAAIDIPDDINELGEALIFALDMYASTAPDQLESAAAEVEQRFLAFQECGRLLEQRIEAA